MPDSKADFFAHAQRLSEVLPHTHSEADTRANLVDPVLRILGYTGFGDIRREVPVPATREVLDYELRSDGRPVAIVEAKAIRNAISDQHAGQCVQYAAVLGIAWCIITNGVTWVLYNAYGKGPLDAKKVAQVRLDGGDLAISEAWRILSLLSKDSLAHANPLTRLLVERVVADELVRPESPAIVALRRAVRDRFGEQVPTHTVLEAIGIVRGTFAPEPSQSLAQPAGTAMVEGGSPARRSGPSSSLASLIQSGLLPPDASIECRLYGVTHVARIRDGTIELNGASYDSPSAAASALRGGKASNGWVTWKYKGQLLSELRDQLGRSSQASDLA